MASACLSLRLGSRWRGFVVLRRGRLATSSRPILLRQGSRGRVRDGCVQRREFGEALHVVSLVIVAQLDLDLHEDEVLGVARVGVDGARAAADGRRRTGRRRARDRMHARGTRQARVLIGTRIDRRRSRAEQRRARRRVDSLRELLGHALGHRGVRRPRPRLAVAHNRRGRQQARHLLAAEAGLGRCMLTATYMRVVGSKLDETSRFLR